MAKSPGFASVLDPAKVAAINCFAHTTIVIRLETIAIRVEAIASSWEVSLASLGT